MALPTAKCTRCEQTFSAPDFKCADGAKHQVESKIYFAPIPGLRLYVNEEHSLKMENGKDRLVPAKLVEFSAGRFVTADPEDQFGLDEHLRTGGLIDQAKWEEIFYSKEDRIKEREKSLAEREERVARSENSLLDQVKSAKGAK